MSTNINKTTNHERFSFKQIAAQVRTLNVEALVALGVPQATQDDRTARVGTIFTGVRPLLVGMSQMAIIPAQWRTAIQLLIGALDELVYAAPPTKEFKAGKDLRDPKEEEVTP